MFGFGKKEKNIAAPVDGRIIDITAVEDEVFSQKLMGDGFAVEPAEGTDTIAAPCDGTVRLLADTLHAVAIDADGLEVLIHIGLDTVELGGNGFAALTQQGAKVHRGDPLIRFDADIIREEGKPLTTMVVLTNGAQKASRIDISTGPKPFSTCAFPPDARSAKKNQCLGLTTLHLGAMIISISCKSQYSQKKQSMTRKSMLPLRRIASRRW